ncbi:hypothetical protein ABG067_004802 [Albugo candida]
MGFVCVECGASVPLLVRDYGGGDKNIHLCICEHCNQICDKYVEYEPFLLFLDLMLFKHQVYRHVLYNRSTPFSLKTVWRMFLVLVMLDMNVKAYLLDCQRGIRVNSSNESEVHETTPTFGFSLALGSKQQLLSGFRLSQFSIQLIIMAFLENLSCVMTMASVILWDPWKLQWQRRRLKNVKGAHCWDIEFWVQFIGTWCLSCFGKIIAVLSVIWEYHWTFFHVMGGIVFCANVLALRLFLEKRTDENATARMTNARQSTVEAAVIVVSGLVARALVQLLLCWLGNPIVFYVLV